VTTIKRGTAATKGAYGMSQENAEAVTPHGVDVLISEAAQRGRDEGRADERDRIRALVAAFPDDSAFALEQYEKGADVTTAKAAYADVLAERLKDESRKTADANARAEAAAAKAEAALAGGVEPLANAGESGPVDIGDLAETLISDGMKPDAAWRKIAREHKAEHAAWVQRGCK
jgi:hypothetical protein